MSAAPDIFISYAHPDRDTARRFAEGFAAQGLEVWWDNSLQAGEVFDEAIEAALRAAKAVVVLWSPHSVSSRWVRAEATLADRNKTLVPALIAPCERPIVFELTQTTDLSHWQGDGADSVWRTFLTDVRAFVGREASAGVSAPAVTAPLPRLDEVSIVVLPFANMSGDPEQEYFADGISEDIITDLSKVSALTVISRNSAFTFKGKHVDVPDVARQLNVTHVVEGSVRKSGNRVRVTAQLIDGSTNGHIWAERYDRELEDIFALQDELSQAIVAALKIKLLPEEKKAIEDRGTDSVEAYDMFLRAWDAYQGDDHATGKAIALARASVAIDPDFSRAWELLASMCRDSSYISPEKSGEYRVESAAAFTRAIATATDPERAHTMRATRLFSMDYDWIGADEAFAEAARAAPAGKLRADMQRAIFLTHLGRLDEGLDEFRAALRLDPMMSPPVFNIALDAAGLIDEADAEYRRQRRIGTVPPLIDFFDVLRIMARDDRNAAKQRFETYASGDTSYFPPAAQIFAAFDDPEKARAVLREAAADPALRNGTHLANLALIAGYFGDIELAVDCLKIAYVELRGVAIAMLWHPLLAQARKTEGFRQIMRDLGQYDYWRTTGHWSELARPLGEDDFELIG